MSEFETNLGLVITDVRSGRASAPQSVTNYVDLFRNLYQYAVYSSKAIFANDNLGA